MSDAQRRALRTLVQVGLVQALIQLYNAFAPVQYDLTLEQQSAITVVATPIVVFIQNWLEDNTSVPTLLKGDGPSSTDTPSSPSDNADNSTRPQPTQG